MEKVNKIYTISVNLNIIFFNYNGSICILLKLIENKRTLGLYELDKYQVFPVHWNFNEEEI